jgi:hypothetical protein
MKKKNYRFRNPVGCTWSSSLPSQIGDWLPLFAIFQGYLEKRQNTKVPETENGQEWSEGTSW